MERLSALSALAPVRPPVGWRRPSAVARPTDTVTLGAGDPRPPAPGRVERAVVVGAGPAGLATAIEMAQRGIRVEILEIRDFEYSRPIHLNLRQAALDGLEALGVYDRVMADAGRIEEEQDLHQGFILFPRDRAPEADRVPRNGHEVMDDDTVVQIETCKLERALHDRCRELGVQMRPHTRADLQPVECQDGSVAYRVTAGATDFGVPDLVVVADGANSPTRKALGIPFEAETEATYFLGGHVDVDLGPVVRKMVTPTATGYPQHLMASGHASEGDTWILVEVDPEHRDLAPEERLGYFCEQASKVAGEPIRPADVDWGGTHLSTVQNRKAGTTVAGCNVILVGDAARTGFAWSSGGANLALTADPQSVAHLLEHVHLDGWSRTRALHYFDVKSRMTSDAWLRPGAAEFAAA